MTYLQFHLVFIVPPIVLLAWLCARRWGPVRTGRHPVLAVLIIMAAAVLYTSIWDNYLIYRGVWSYGTDRVLGTIGYVPVEEYLFFLLQPVLTSLFLYAIIVEELPQERPVSPRVRLVGAVCFAVLFVAGVALMWGDESGLYLGLIMGWSCPILALQWGLRGDVLWSHRRLIITSILVPTIYLWIADGTAIALGIWEIAEATTLGLSIGVLPVEEAVFFLATNVMVVFGVALLLPIQRPE